MEEMQKSLQEMLERVLSEKFDKFFPELKMRAGEGTSLRARVGDFRKDLDAVKQEQVAWPMPQERAPPPANRAARFAYGGPPAPCDSTEATADATAVQGLVVPDPLADALSTLTSCSTERLTQVEAVAQQIGADSVPERWSMLEEKLEVKLKPLEAKLSPLATDLRARVGAITTHLDAVQRARAPAAHPRDPAQVHISGAGNGVPQPYVPPHDTGEPEDHLWGHVDEEFGPEYAHRGDEVPRGCRGIRHDDDDCPDRRDVRHDDDDYNDRRDGFRLKPPKHAFSVFKGYKACWLPLLPKQTEAADADEALVVPLDGEWIWHCHRLNPTQCIKDCKRLYGRILDTNNVKSIQAKSKDQVEKVWTELYPGEPVELQCTSPSEDSVYLSDGTAGGISYDLVSAVKRQFSFIYQVGTPNMHYHCFLEEIKQEAAYYSDIDGLNGSKLFGSEKRASLDGCSGPDTGVGSGRKAVRSALNPVKLEDDMPREGETTFTMFASLLDSAIQGLMPFLDAILQFERTCRNASESLRYAATGKVWSLLSYLYGKANEELPGELFMSPTTSHQEACRYVATDLTAQLCLRIVLWLEGLSYESFDLEKKVRGSYVGSYLPSSGVWHHTQRYLKRRNNDSNIVKHVDFDAPTREVAQLLPDDKKDEDIWTLLRAGRLDEALFPSLEAMLKNGNARTLQAIGLESGIGRQWRLRKWASYCASEKIAEHDGGQYEMDVYALQCSNLKRTLPICTDEESACWAMAKSWLDVKVDLELSQYQTSRQEEKGFDDDMNGTQRDPENWPYHVLDQQPRDIAALLQKLHSIDLVHETVSQACREQEELAGVYASQLERDVCIDLFVEMMELSLNSSLHTMYKLFLSSVEYLPFSSGDPSKACFEEIIEGVLSRSRETKPHEYNADFSDLAERHHLQTLQKAMVIQWLCFTPPPSIPGFQMITGKLLMRALMHNNTLFREFSLISMRRVPELPVGPHKLLATLAEPLKQKENLFSLEYQEVSDNLEEFEDWHEYYFRDATYRGWLRCERENSYVPPEMLSAEEKDQAVAATTQTLELAFKLFGSFKVVDRISENAPQPEAILDRHMVKQGKAATVQILIQWSSLPVDCATWEDYYVLKARFLMRQSGMHLQLKGRQLSHPHLLTRWCLTY